MSEAKAYQTFDEFYPFYLGEHANRTCRRLHFVGTSTAAVLFAATLVTGNWRLALIALLQGYAFAWVGHFFFEHNRPATFKYPLFSLMGDWLMFWQLLTGKISFGSRS